MNGKDKRKKTIRKFKCTVLLKQYNPGSQECITLDDHSLRGAAQELGLNSQKRVYTAREFLNIVQNRILIICKNKMGSTS